MQLDPERAVGGGGDLRLELAEFERREAHRAGHRLAMHEHVLERRLQKVFADILRHFHEVADHVVVLDAKRAAAGLGRIAPLERRNESARILLQLARLVEIGIVARAHEAAVAPHQRQILAKGSGKIVGGARVELAERAAGKPQLVRQRAGCKEHEAEVPGGEKTVAQTSKIARAAASESEPREGARKIGRALEDGAQPLAQIAVLEQEGRRRPGAFGSRPRR